MDTIFGEGNMRNEIAWKKYVGRKNNAKLRFNTQHDTILFYAKSEKSTFTVCSFRTVKKKLPRIITMWTNTAGSIACRGGAHTSYVENRNASTSMKFPGVQSVLSGSRTVSS